MDTDKGHSPNRSDYRASHGAVPSPPKASIPNAALHVLCGAYQSKIRDMAGKRLYMIDRTLGYKTWASHGAKGRKDIAPLYAHGLIEEYHHPFSPPCCLTERGEKMRSKARKELGYDD